jgi:WD40 repeat protein
MLASGSRDETIRIWNVETFACAQILEAKKPYEKMDITGATGLSPTQKDNLLGLGAVNMGNGSVEWKTGH